MFVTIARIIRAWPSNIADSSFGVLIDCGANNYIEDIIPSFDREFIVNHVNSLIYICDMDNAPNNVIPGTGRVMTVWEDDTLHIMPVQNNHYEVGQRVEIHV